MNTQPPNHGRTLVNVPLDRTKDFVCPQCGNQFFRPTIIFRVVPALLSPTMKEERVPQQAFACEKCRCVLDMTVPTPERKRRGAKILQTVLQIVQTVAPFLQKKR